MILKGLEHYDITDTDGELKVWSQRQTRFVNPRRDGYYLYPTDDKERKHMSAGFIRFLMAHPEIDARLIRPQEQGIRFTEGGNVIALYEGKKGRKYCVFGSLEDALETVLLLMSAREGDYEPLLTFIHEHREAAIGAVANLLCMGRRRVEAYAEAGEQKFLEQTRTARVERIMPLYAWLCKCIKSAVKESLVKISDTKLDRTLRMENYQEHEQQ